MQNDNPLFIGKYYTPTPEELELRELIVHIRNAYDFADQLAILEGFLRKKLWERGIGDPEDHLPPENLPQICLECDKTHLTNLTCAEAAAYPDDLIDMA